MAPCQPTPGPSSSFVSLCPGQAGGGGGRGWHRASWHPAKGGKVEKFGCQALVLGMGRRAQAGGRVCVMHVWVCVRACAEGLSTSVCVPLAIAGRRWRDHMGTALRDPESGQVSSLHQSHSSCLQPGAGTRLCPVRFCLRPAQGSKRPELQFMERQTQSWGTTQSLGRESRQGEQRVSGRRQWGLGELTSVLQGRAHHGKNWRRRRGVLGRRAACSCKGREAASRGPEWRREGERWK